MNPVTCGDEIVELHFYGELPPVDVPAAAAHIAGCQACRQSLADLRAIDAALSARRVDAPPAGDWSGFMRRLDARIDAAPERLVPAEPRAAAARHSWMQAAAALFLIASGVAAGWMMSRLSDTPPSASLVSAAADRAIADAGDSGLERARMVLAGLAGKDANDGWSLERGMAARLLPEVTLIRQAAAQRGRSDLEDILMDVETLLLQASYAETDDPETLARLRGMIDRRDLLMRLSVASGSADAPYGAPPAVSRPGA
jgi:hypothetical protein